MDETSDFLLKWVILDKKPISARLYARLRRVHVSQARDEMQAFFETKNGKEAFATYFVTGRSKEAAADDTQMTQGSMEVDEEAEGGSQAGPSGAREADVVSVPERSEMLLVGQDKLKEVEERLDQVFTKQLYALSPPLPDPPTEASKVATMSSLSTIAQDLRSHQELVQAWEDTGRGVQLGVIANDEIKDAGPSKTFVPNGKAAGSGGHKVAPAPAKATATVKSEPISKPSPAAAAAASSVSSKSAADKKKSSGLDWSKAKKEAPTVVEKKAASKRKTAESDEDDDEDEPDAGPIGYKDEDEEMGEAKAAGDVAPEQGGATRKRADAGDKADEERKRREAKKKELMDMMDDDDEPGAKDPPVETSKTPSTSMMKGTETKTDKAKTSANRSSKAEEGPDKPVKRRVRKHREIITGKEKIKNEKGYWVSKEIKGYESYSSDESDSPPTKAKSAASSKRSEEQKEASAKSSSNDKESPAAPAAPASEAKSAASSAAPSPAPSAPTKSGTASKKAGGQSKLSSFFGKPKG